MADEAWGIRSSLDRWIGDHVGEAGRACSLQIEEQFLNRFNRVVLEHLPADARSHFEVGLTRRDRVLAWEVMAHYGCPTRLVDWTKCPYFAALVASLDEKAQDGAIWWYDQEAWLRFVRRRWTRWRVPIRQDSRERHFEAVCFQGRPSTFVIQMAPRAPFHRMALQRGYHTACPNFGLDHDAILSEWLGAKHFGKLVLHHEFKGRVRDWLWRERRLNAGQMDWPVANAIAATLAVDSFGRLQPDSVPRSIGGRAPAASGLLTRLDASGRSPSSRPAPRTPRR